MKTISSKSEKTMNAVNNLSAKYDWFCFNGGTADDIAVNLTIHAYLEDGLEEVEKIIYKMPIWLKKDVIDACLARVTDYVDDCIQNMDVWYLGNTQNFVKMVRLLNED